MIDPSLDGKIVLSTGANHGSGAERCQAAAGGTAVAQEANFANPDNIPLRGIGQPAHLANVILFMALQQVRWVTSQLIYAGGGWRMGQ